MGKTDITVEMKSVVEISWSNPHEMRKFLQNARRGGACGRLLPAVLLAAVVAVVMVAVLPSSDVSALDDSGQIGDDVYYAFDSSTGTLTISGSGEMWSNYNVGDNTSPFYGNTDIVKVVIEEGVTTVGNHMFYNCTSIVSVEFPSTLTLIGMEGFSGCSSLVDLDLSGTQVVNIGYENSGSDSFYKCTSLVSVEFPSTLTYLWEYAFAECSKLIEVDLSNTQVVTIDVHCFDSCTSLTTVKLPATLETMNSNVFNDCSNLETVTFYGDKAPPNSGIYGIDKNSMDSGSEPYVTIYTNGGWGDEDVFGSARGNTTFIYESTMVLTITYDMNGGSGSISSQYGDYRADGTESTTRLSSVVPTRSGYTFLGWSEDKDATSAEYSAGGTFAFSSPDDVTLYAVWDDGSGGDGDGGGTGHSGPVYSYTVNFDANGGDGAPITQRYTSSSTRVTLTIPSTEPTRSGYTFLGWATDPSATTAEYYSTGSITLASDGSFSTSVTLYAVWTAGSGSGSGSGDSGSDGGSGSRSGSGDGSGSGSGTSDGDSGDSGSDWWIWILVILIIIILVAISGYMGYRARGRS